MGTLRWLISGLFATLSLSLAAVEVKPDAPETYVVKKGDTLWDISGMYLDNPWFWPELWRHNTTIENPHLIYPGDVLRLKFDDAGEPVLLVESKPELILSPQGHKTRKTQPIPTISPDVLAPFVEEMLVVDVLAYQNQPRVLGDYHGQVMYASDDILMTEAYGEPAARVVVRKQGELKDMRGNVLGVQGRKVADVEKLDDSSGKHHLIRVDNTNYETVQGDRLLPKTWLPVQKPLPLVPAPAGVTGFVIDNFQSHKLMGKYDVVVVDLGREQAAPGMVMGLYNEGETVDASEEKPRYTQEGQTWLTGEDNIHRGPAIKVGELILFQVFDRVSYGLIVEAEDFIQRGTRVGHP
ncbi:Phage-like element PBSX protein XkdP [Saliniradius amylolyticus]|uniref:Phage-like element PBSX protein XkdP n=1 Tax=Saliniradius amylolyticus TaxID=2183582 RepID=A0A2S2E0K1_9ALTE|nr:LysM domain-containing protein [Saliniradius amylolyticus]AWL10537.1 Phage-like element PBSX protein XkdP [Saliniradius amylolyticus]